MRFTFAFHCGSALHADGRKFPAVRVEQMKLRVAVALQFMQLTAFLFDRVENAAWIH